MIDIHTHILPGLDDGAQDIEDALSMAELAAESGVTAIVATPHSNWKGVYTNYWDKQLRRDLVNFQKALVEAEIAVTIFSGMEIFGTPDVPELLREGKLITLAGSRYPLIEFPFQDYDQQATQVLADVTAMGYRPVVAHPERYRYAQEFPPLLNRWVEMGCLLQVNKGSLMGRFGPAAEMLALSLLDRGFAAFAASDAHSPVVRTTWMAGLRDFLCEEYSENLAQLLLVDNPQKVLEDAEIHLEEPEWF